MDTSTDHIKQSFSNQLQKKIRWKELFIEKIIMGASFLSIASIALIFIFIFRESIPVFFGFAESSSVPGESSEMETYGDTLTDSSQQEKEKELEKKPAEEKENVPLYKKLLSSRWQPVSQNPLYGLIPLVVGSWKVTFVAILISAPLGILAALYSAMFAPKWLKETVKPVIEVLAGFPSVVIGFFMLVILATVLQNMFNFQYRLNAFTGGVALSLTIIPLIFTISEDSMVVVPNSIIDASHALGAYKWETALYVVFPAAMPGIFAAVLLGIGRAMGETMIALMVTGNAALLSFKLDEPVRTMAAAIGAEMAEVVFGDVHYSVLFFLGVLLFILSLALNVFAEVVIRQRFLKRFKGS